MISDFHGKVAVVTGGAGGLGKALARVFLEKGAQVAILDRSHEVIAAAASELSANHLDRVLALETDVTSEDSVRAAADAVMRRFGAVHVLVNNAGIVLRGIPAGDMPIASMQHVMDVNFYGAVRCVSQFLPLIRASGGGHIVNIASMSGYIIPADRFTVAYTASKFALAAYSETLAAELAGSDVGVTVVAPAGISTDIYVNSALQFGDLSGKIMDKTPDDLRNGLPPEVIARKIVAAMGTSEPLLMTHPETIDWIRARYERIASSYSTNNTSQAR
jgi:NAD(P)-dependent dehydrogenase (short-subunit alcohol dehydrogenase family)